jgi:hypothetical protein
MCAGLIHPTDGNVVALVGVADTDAVVVGLPTSASTVSVGLGDGVRVVAAARRVVVGVGMTVTPCAEVCETDVGVGIGVVVGVGVGIVVGVAVGGFRATVFE